MDWYIAHRDWESHSPHIVEYPRHAPYRIVADGTRTFDALANARCTIESMEWYIAIGTGTIVSTCRSGRVCVTLDWGSPNGIVRTSGRAGDIGDQRRL